MKHALQTSFPNIKVDENICLNLPICSVPMCLFKKSIFVITLCVKNSVSRAQDDFLFCGRQEAAKDPRKLGIQGSSRNICAKDLCVESENSCETSALPCSSHPPTLLLFGAVVFRAHGKTCSVSPTSTCCVFVFQQLNSSRKTFWDQHVLVSRILLSTE